MTAEARRKEILAELSASTAPVYKLKRGFWNKSTTPDNNEPTAKTIKRLE